VVSLRADGRVDLHNGDLNDESAGLLFSIPAIEPQKAKGLTLTSRYPGAAATSHLR
jgi:hypothetical protein